MVRKTFLFGFFAAATVSLIFACTVDTKKADLLYEFYECEDDSDCVDDWVCRIALGPEGELGRYCVLECQSDDDCKYDLVCGRMGRCTWAEFADIHAACTGDEECPEGFSCWWFQFDDPDNSYCLKRCTDSNECVEGQICGFQNADGEGHCVDRCYIDRADVCPSGWSCMLENVNPNSTEGYCHPGSTCANDDECVGAFDICLMSELDRLVPGDLPMAEEGSPCVTSCGGTACQAAYKCLPDVVHGLAFDEEVIPEICLPTCAGDGVCPPGFRCLRDILEDILPFGDWSTKNICYPGLSFVDLPCRLGVGDCYHGVCTERPDQPVSYCAVHCDPQGQCGYDEYFCLDTNDDSVRDQQDFCFKAGCITPGDPTECGPGETCRTFDLAGDARPVCSRDCNDFRQDRCPPAQTCMLSDQMDFGCMDGYQGLPCFDDNDCYDTGPLDEVCLGSTGDASDVDRICTRPCSDDNQCDWLNRESPMAGYCRGPVCWPWAYYCDPSTGDGLWIDCPDTEMTCLPMGGGGEDGLCTLRCTESRPAIPGECPLYGGCLETGNTAFYCFPGFLGIPCAHGSECLDILGGNTATCESITGSNVRVDGTCSVPCVGDDGCRILEEVNAFCMPGITQDGQCFLNPAFESIFNADKGLQGMACFGTDQYCDPDYHCHNPPGQVGPKMDFCAQECNPMDNPACSTADHDCVQDSNGLRHICLPLAPYPAGRAMGVTCYDHRQCERAICFTAETTANATDWEGYCTRRCGSQGGDCPPTWNCSDVCRKPNEQDVNP